MGILSERQKDFTTQNHNLIYSFLEKYNLDTDEFYDLAAIGLCKASANFDSSKGIKFSVYAYRIMLNEILLELRKKRSTYRVPEYLIQSYEEVLKDETGLTMQDCIPNSSNTEAEALIKIELELIRCKLNNKELQVMNLIMDGYTQRQIGQMLNISQSYVSRIYKDIKLKYNKFLGG